jgi:Ni/Co efflux regulator RcnB
MSAGEAEYFVVTLGMKASAITVATNGVLHVTECSAMKDNRTRKLLRTSRKMDTQEARKMERTFRKGAPATHRDYGPLFGEWSRAGRHAPVKYRSGG